MILRVLMFIFYIATMLHADIALEASEGEENHWVLELDCKYRCVYPYPQRYTDNVVAKGTINLVMPEDDGPIKSTGSFTHKGTGYSVKGKLIFNGHKKGEVLSFQDPPGFMSDGKQFYNRTDLITIPIKDGAEGSLPNLSAHGVKCTGDCIWRLRQIEEEQTWLVKLSGQETDDLGGSTMRMKIAKDWKNVTVDYGVRFNWNLTGEFTIKKKKGKWVYKDGKVTSADTTAIPVFDVKIFKITNFKCKNCAKAKNLAGIKIKGSVDGKTVRLVWPGFIPKMLLDWKYKVKISKDGKIKDLGYARNYFFSSNDFLSLTSNHVLPLKEGHPPPKKVERNSHKDAYRLLNKKPISIYYQYYLKRLK